MAYINFFEMSYFRPQTLVLVPVSTPVASTPQCPLAFHVMPFNTLISDDNPLDLHYFLSPDFLLKSTELDILFLKQENHTHAAK